MKRSIKGLVAPALTAAMLVGCGGSGMSVDRYKQDRQHANEERTASLCPYRW